MAAVLGRYGLRSGLAVVLGSTFFSVLPGSSQKAAPDDGANP